MRVEIVIDSGFGMRLASLDMSSPIWIVQSATNNPVIARLWEAKAENITSFRPQEFGQLVDTVDQHHFGWREIVVYGLVLEDGVPSLAEYGEGTAVRTKEGFVFSRFNADNSL